MHSPTRERRVRPRSRIQFPVIISATKSSPEAHGITRDVSPAGVYFYTERALTLGQVIDFQMLLPIPGQESATAACRGTVVRLDLPVIAAIASRGVAVAIERLKLA